MQLQPQHFVVLFCLVSLALSDDCNATTSNFLSPHSLGKQDEVTDALAVLCKQVQLGLTVYEYGKASYSLYGFKVNCSYNDGKQIANVTSEDTVNITGGKIEFAMNFTYNVSKIGPDRVGWAYGKECCNVASVMTDVISFEKIITVGEPGHLTWIINNNTQNISISSALAIKRIDPKPTDDDLLALNQALSQAISAIKPKNVKSQILELFNANYTTILNSTLKEEKIFTPSFNYTFAHPYKGNLTIELVNEGFGHRINSKDGFELYYRTLIDGWNKSDCKYAIPDNHENYDMYGGIQTYISMDVPRHIARYNLQRRWLDTTLDGSGWETNAFQFYVGDLYDVIS